MLGYAPLHLIRALYGQALYTVRGLYTRASISRVSGLSSHHGSCILSSQTVTMPLLSRISRRSSVRISSPRWKLKLRKSYLSPVPVVLKESLRLIKESSDVFPPMKSVAGGLYCFVDAIDVRLTIYTPRSGN